jgi:hypothetical protein
MVWLTAFLAVLFLSAGFSGLARSENSQTGQYDQGMFQEKQNRDKAGSLEGDQLFPPATPPSSGGNYLLLQPDGRTPLDYQKFLTPPDQDDKRPQH